MADYYPYEPDVIDFAIRILGEVQLGGLTFFITETMVSTWIVLGLILIFAAIVRIKSNSWNALDKPSGLQNFVELCVDIFAGFFKNSASPKLMYLAPWFFSLFVFLLVSNTIGITGLRPPTADWGVTFPLAFSSFILFQYAGFKYRPKNYVKGWLNPTPIFLPINLLGEFARPVALSFRLFGNVLGGVVLLSLLYGIAPVVMRFVFPAFLHMYFDLAAGLLQAFIFTVLSLTFVGLAAED